ncbi:MAG: hypothetical protein ACKOSQ_10865 [Planctomycetaceae bacterium]
MPLWPALVPPGLYLLAVAARHLHRRPTAVTGAWDLGLLAAVLAPLLLVGPLELLQPPGLRGPWRLVLPLVFVALVAALALLAARPRLVVYNVSLEQLRPVVAHVAATLDPPAQRAGETVALPGREIQVHLDGRGPMRSVSLVAVGSRTSAEAWAEFARRVRGAVRRIRVRRSPWAAVLAAAGLAFLATAAWLAWRGS